MNNSAGITPVWVDAYRNDMREDANRARLVKRARARSAVRDH